jgi:hypothetical protein
VRVFIAPETEIEDPRAWVEMDRFFTTLNPNERKVVHRPADLSSVVRQPALKWFDVSSDDGASPNREQNAWCDCGWPYTLLLPRGTAEGMAFRLFVMLSPGSDLDVSAQGNGCTSMAYCGLEKKRYPDSREMGYPFNRPFRKSISETVASSPNMAWRRITIRHTGPVTPEK